MRTRPAARLPLLVGVITAIALVAVACSSSAATPTPSVALASPASNATASPAPAQPSSAAATAATAAPSAAPSAMASQTVEPGTAAPLESASTAPTAAPTAPPVPSFVIPSFTSDAQLEAELPATYQGVTLRKLSFKGTSLFNSASQSTKDFQALLGSLGKTPDDLSFAVASDPLGKLGVAFGGYRIKGADATVWAPSLYQGIVKQIPGTTETDANLGGKAVRRIVSPTTKQITYAWPKGDVLFIVSSTTDALAGPAIAVMP